jgi:hypothetical protein
MCLVTVRVKVMKDLSDFQKGQIVGARLAVASVTNTATSLAARKAAFSKVVTTYTNHVNTSANRNSGQKPKLRKRDLLTLKRIMSKNHLTAAAKVTAELNIHLEEPVATQTV